MTGRWLEEAVATSRLPVPQVFPRNLDAEVDGFLDVSLESLPNLTSGGVSRWLAKRGVHHRVADTERGLHGCMVAHVGNAMLLLDSQDSPEEQRFTLAHEVAHFVLDHLLPRAWALRAFGASIQPVLDGLRAPTPQEVLSSHFDDVPLGVQVKLMDRSPSGTIQTSKVVEAERRADRLAYELLAPASYAQETLSDGPVESRAQRLSARFGLTPWGAREYIQLLLPRQRPQRFSLVEMLGGARR
ncbi:ImmA/IrrE family metallo-endopeptidase [Myxococcus sp. CA040A]|uniref:ImmA/IrrE family metallo-endopeptidase n=1 Tax=Myxococcus sp. CA040A TaxID=2741738 RepID=UPI00157AC13C|nr:ImmA/IrrE family metallo-endopeptidase [Myxococcus sp. CA040A]NTX01824.1 ImmA/IrrE family metallo-endopeptidase [Myxococcus sp. CA040A]